MIMFYTAILFVILATFGVIGYNFVDLKDHKEGTAEMKELAAIIREGAKTFMNRELTVIVPTVLIISAVYSLFMEKYCGLSLLFGSTLSWIAVNISMRGGTYAGVRTANAARKTRAISRTIRIALMGGSISGFSVEAFGLFGFIIVYIVSGGIQIDVTGHGIVSQILCNPTTMRLTTYSLGCSTVAMFNRVAGGNYTKAADISADIVGKNVHKICRKMMQECLIP